MDGKKYFDAVAYFRELAELNWMARRNGFVFAKCSGVENLQEPILRMKQDHAFFVLDETNDGTLFQGRSGGWFKTRIFTIFLLHRCKQGDMADRQQKLNVCREVFRQTLSKMLMDERRLENDMIYIRTSGVLAKELGTDVLNGLTGLYFMVEMSEPVDLSIDKEEWLRPGVSYDNTFDQTFR